MSAVAVENNQVANNDDDNKDINTYAQGEDAEYVPGEEEWDDDFKKIRWDEGGQSDCGYSETVHETLMSVGKCMYSLFGEPGDKLHGKMKGIGSYFQEASYAARDWKRGDLKKEEVGELVKDLTRDQDEDDDEVEEDEGSLGSINEEAVEEPVAAPILS